MKSILQERDKLFVNYLKIRSGLISGEVLADQMQSLSGLINNTASQIDSTVITTQKKISTTTVLPKDSVQAAPRESGGLLARIFGKKKEVEAAMSNSSQDGSDTANQPKKIGRAHV